MLESIPQHFKFVAMILLFLLIIPSFILVGIDSNYFSGSSPAPSRGLMARSPKTIGTMPPDGSRSPACRATGLDAKLLDTPEARYATLERLVRDRVFQVAAQKLHLLAASDATLARELQKIPAIANLRKADGSLDTEG